MLTLRDYLVEDLKLPQWHFWLCNRLIKCGWWMRYFKLACLCFICELLLSNYDRNHFPNFNKLQLLTLVTNSVTNRSWSLTGWPYLYSTRFTFIEFVFKLVVACSFARVIKSTRRKPFEFKWPGVRFNSKQTSMTPVPYNKLLTNLASSSHTWEYWPSVVLYGPSSARSVLPRPRANILQYWPPVPSDTFSNLKDSLLQNPTVK